MNPTLLNLYLALLLLSLICCICYQQILPMLISLLDWLTTKLHWFVRKQEELREELRKEKEKL